MHVSFSAVPFRLDRVFLPGRPVAPSGRGGPAAFRIDSLHSQDCAEARQVALLLQDYFESGRPINVPWQWISLDRMTRLQQRVLRIAAEIPYGRVCTYRDIAVELGKPGAARFVGNTMGANPYPLLIPCHRVIRSSGAAGGFGGGTAMKEALLAHEGHGKHPVLAH